MKHKLYTTYLAKMKQIPDPCQIVIIMRFPPFLPKDGDIIHCPELSPKGKLLNVYKADKDFDTFKDNLWEQWEGNEEGAMDTLKLIEEALEHNDICLVCCEKDVNECHRLFLGGYFKFLGYEWEEL